MPDTHWKIAQPCHEPLNKMAVIDKGYLCQRCQKNVFDLSQVSTVPAEPICGYIVKQGMPVLSPAGKWSGFLLRWLGTAALLFIPMKKGKPALSSGTITDPIGENKKAFGPKRIMGVVRDAAHRPVRTLVQVSDDHGNVLAETRSLINGRYMIVLDTPAVDTPQITITALDTTAYKIRLDTAWVLGYPKDGLWLNQDIEVTAGVPPMWENHPIKFEPLHAIGPNMLVYPLSTTQTLESGAIAGAQNLKS